MATVPVTSAAGVLALLEEDDERLQVPQEASHALVHYLPHIPHTCIPHTCIGATSTPRFHTAGICIAASGSHCR